MPQVFFFFFCSSRGTGAQRPLVPPKPPNRRARFTTTITAERIAENHNVLSDTEASLSPRATNTSDNEMEDDGGFSILTYDNHTTFWCSLTN